MKAYWFVNYTEIEHGRTTKVKMFYRLKDAEAFILEHQIYGYLIRQAESNTFVKFFRGFIPTAHVEQAIENLLSH